MHENITINIIAMLGISCGLNGKCLHALLFNHVVKEGITGNLKTLLLS